MTTRPCDSLIRPLEVTGLAIQFAGVDVIDETPVIDRCRLRPCTVTHRPDVLAEWASGPRPA